MSFERAFVLWVDEQVGRTLAISAGYLQRRGRLMFHTSREAVNHRFSPSAWKWRECVSDYPGRTFLSSRNRGRISLRLSPPYFSKKALAMTRAIVASATVEAAGTLVTSLRS